MTQTNVRIIGWSACTLAVLIAAAAVKTQADHLDSASADLVRAQRSLVDATAARKAAMATVNDLRFAVAKPGPAEELAFVENLRGKARRAGVAIESITTTSMPPAGSTVRSLEEKKKLAYITEMRTEMRVSGPYEKVRAFLLSIQKESRLANLRSINWERKDSISEISFALSRYVTSEAEPAGGAPIAP